MWQRPADRADAPCFGRVQADHRGAFGEPVAFEHRQAEALGAVQHLRRHATTTHRDEAQRSRQRYALFGGADQRQQQLRQQDQAVRLVLVQRREQARQLETCGAAEADLGQRAQLDPGTCQQRRVEPGDVFQQGGGSTHRCCRTSHGRLTCHKLSATASCASASRQTPLGWPVVPEV